MVEISGSRFEPVADVTQGDAVCELTKHHAYQMAIRIKAFRVFVGVMFRKYPFKIFLEDVVLLVRKVLYLPLEVCLFFCTTKVIIFTSQIKLPLFFKLFWTLLLHDNSSLIQLFP